jgi:hypothetical protein
MQSPCRGKCLIFKVGDTNQCPVLASAACCRLRPDSPCSPGAPHEARSAMQIDTCARSFNPVPGGSGAVVRISAALLSRKRGLELMTGHVEVNRPAKPLHSRPNDPSILCTSGQTMVPTLRLPHLGSSDLNDLQPTCGQTMLQNLANRWFKSQQPPPNAVLRQGWGSQQRRTERSAGARFKRSCAEDNGGDRDVGGRPTDWRQPAKVEPQVPPAKLCRDTPVLI